MQSAGHATGSSSSSPRQPPMFPILIDSTTSPLGRPAWLHKITCQSSGGGRRKCRWKKRSQYACQKSDVAKTAASTQQSSLQNTQNLHTHRLYVSTVLCPAGLGGESTSTSAHVKNTLNTTTPLLIRKRYSYIDKIASHSKGQMHTSGATFPFHACMHAYTQGLLEPLATHLSTFLEQELHRRYDLQSVRTQIDNMNDEEGTR